MVLKTAGRVLVVFLWSVTATTATKCVQKSQVVVASIVDKNTQKITLTCVTNCTLTNVTYIWYRNGQILNETTTREYSVIGYYSSSYSCSVKGLEDLHSPTVCVLGRNCFDVTYTNQRICALKGSTADFPCTYRHLESDTVSDTNWYFQRELHEVQINLNSLPEYSGRVKYLGNNMSDCTLRISDLRESDSAEYKFRFKTRIGEWGYSFPGTTLTVTDLEVKVTPVSGDNTTKTLTCATTCNLTDNSNLPYVWYKNGQRLDEPVSSQHSVKQYYADSYSCSMLDIQSPVVCVVGQICMRVKYSHQSACALKGSTVNISCTFNHLTKENVTEETWFNIWDSGVIKDLTQDPEYAGRVEYHQTTDKDSTLRITDLRESDSAEYKFRFTTTNKVRWGYSFPGTTLTVTDLQVNLTPATEEGKMNLTCITSCPLTDNPTYIWYKNGQRLTNQQTMTSYLILDPDNTEDRGRYSCAVKGLEDLGSPEFSVGEQTYVTEAVVGIIVVVILILSVCLSGFIWFRKKTSKSTSDRQDKAVIRETYSNPVYENQSDMAMTSTAAQTPGTDNQDLLHYSNIQFSSSKKQMLHLRKPDQNVQYASVLFRDQSDANKTA